MYTRSIVTNFLSNTSPLRWSFGGNKSWEWNQQQHKKKFWYLAVRKLTQRVFHISDKALLQYQPKELSGKLRSSTRIVLVGGSHFSLPLAAMMPPVVVMVVPMSHDGLLKEPTGWLRYYNRPVGGWDGKQEGQVDAGIWLLSWRRPVTPETGEQEMS